jgi:hypothetical protein
MAVDIQHFVHIHVINVEGHLEDYLLHQQFDPFVNVEYPANRQSLQHLIQSFQEALQAGDDVNFLDNFYVECKYVSKKWICMKGGIYEIFLTSKSSKLLTKSFKYPF